MSISSMLGSDPERSSREPTSRGRSNGHNAPSGSAFASPVPHSNRPSSPQSFATLNQQSKRSHTPESFRNWQGASSRPSRAYSGGTGQRQYPGHQASSSEGPPLGPPSQPGQSAQSYNMNPSNGTGFKDTNDPQNRRLSMGHLEHKGLGQTPAFRTLPPESDYNRDGRPLSMIDRSSSGLAKYAVSQDNAGQNELVGMDPRGRAKAGSADADLRPTNNAPARMSYGPRPDATTAPPATNYPFLSRPPHQGPTYEQRHQSTDNKSQDRAADLTQPRPTTSQSTNLLDTFRRLRDSPFAGTGQLQQESGPPHLINHTNPAEQQQSSVSRSPTLSRHPFSGMADRADHSMGGMKEGYQQSKSFLGLIADDKRGRVSPLPQAVQGAQGRIRGSGNEPGIKTEFSRMFSGIGSGSATSTPVPVESGTPHSFPSSPTRMDDSHRRTPFSAQGELSESKPRAASRGGRRSRKPKDEESKGEGDGIEGHGLTRTISGRGAKRSRQSYQTHTSPQSVECMLYLGEFR